MDNQAANPANKHKKILVVEDEQYLRDLYVELLTEEGYNVDFAEDGQIGYQKILDNIYALVLLDLIMPRMPGITLLRKLEEENYAQKQKQKIVILTNLGQDSIIAEAIAL